MENLDQVLFRTVENEQDGRHLVALRDLEEGELIFSEHPIVQGPGDSQEVCIVCCLPNTKDVCPRCWWQVCEHCTSTKIHQGECRILSSCMVKGPDSGLPSHLILQLRTILLQRNLRIWEKVEGLGDHGIQSAPLPDEYFIQEHSFNELATFIREDCGLKVSDKDLITAHKAVSSSAIQSKIGGRNLSGLYLQGGLLTHSCIQNTRIVLKGKIPKLFVYASVSIKKGDKITFCRLPEVVATGTQERRRILRESYIQCQCKRCCDPSECGANTSSIFCQRCSGVSVPVIEGKGEEEENEEAGDEERMVWECLECQERISAQFVNTLLLGIKEENKLVKGSRSERYKIFRERNKNILHRNHYLQTSERAKFFLQFSQENSDESLLRISAGKELLELVDLLDPGLSIFRESILVNLGTSLQLLLTDQIVKRQDDEDCMETRQIYAAFRDAFFCFKEAKKAAILEEDPDVMGCSPTLVIDESLQILQEMRDYFDSTAV